MPRRRQSGTAPADAPIPWLEEAVRHDEALLEYDAEGARDVARRHFARTARSIRDVLERHARHVSLREAVTGEPRPSASQLHRKELRLLRASIDPALLERGTHETLAAFEALSAEEGFATKSLPLEAFLDRIGIQTGVDRYQGRREDMAGAYHHSDFDRTGDHVFEGLRTGLHVIEYTPLARELRFGPELATVELLRVLAHDALVGHARSATGVQAVRDYTSVNLRLVHILRDVCPQVGFPAYFSIVEPLTDGIARACVRPTAEAVRAMCPEGETPVQRMQWLELTLPDFPEQMVAWLADPAAESEVADAAAAMREGEMTPVQRKWWRSMRRNYAGTLGGLVRRRPRLGSAEQAEALESALRRVLYGGTEAMAAAEEEMRSALGVGDGAPLREALAAYVALGWRQRTVAGVPPVKESRR